MEDLEGLILDAEQEIQQKRPLRDLAAKISEIYYSYPLLAALGTGTLFVGMNRFPQSPSNLMMGFLGVGSGFMDSYFGRKYKKLKSPLKKSRVLRNLAYATAISAAHIISVNDLSEFWERTDLVQILAWSSLVVKNAFFFSLANSFWQWVSSGPGVSSIYRQFGDMIQRKALKENDMDALESSETCYLKPLEYSYSPYCVVQLLINFAQRDDSRAFEPLNQIVEYFSTEGLWQETERSIALSDGQKWLDDPESPRAQHEAGKVFKLIAENTEEYQLRNIMDKFIEILINDESPYLYYGHILRSSFFRGQGETEKARQDLTKAAHLLVDLEETIFDDPGFRHSRRGYWISDFPGAHSSLFFQEATPEQAEMAMAVYNIMGYRVGEVLDYIPEIGILVQRRENSVLGSNFLEAVPYLDERQLFKTLYNVNESLVVFQGLESELLKKGIVLDVPAEDNPDYYADRMWEVFVLQSSDHGIKIPAETTDEMRDIIYRIGPLMNKYTQVPYWDGNWRNILRILNYSEKLVDFENRCKKGWPIDLISLTEFRAIPEKQKTKLWAQYKLRQGIPIEEFMSGISIGGVIRHSELTGYSWRNYDLLEEDGVEDIVAAIYHLETASRHSLRSARIFDPGFSNDFERYAEILQDLAFNASQEYQKEIDEYREMEKQRKRQIRRDNSLIYPIIHDDPHIAQSARKLYLLMVGGGIAGVGIARGILEL